MTAKDLKPELTPKQKKKFLKNPSVCPFCGSNDIEGKLPEIDCGACWQSVSCVACKRKWDEIYKLVDVEATDRD